MRLRQGLIDRGRPIRFTFDGRPVDAFQGDTVASALVAAGIRLVGRSFKYHRPRGIVSAGSEEPNALVTIGTGARATPNTRATLAEAVDGLAVASQNRWPSLRADALAVNDLAAPLLGAGFYYKTFMWPRRFWTGVYEPAIRRAAGLGALSGLPDPDRSEKAFAFADVLVIGGGPAGLSAALGAARAGERVILAEQDALLGGRLTGETEAIDGAPAMDWVRSAEAELRRLGARIMTRTTVTGAYDGGVWGALERVADHRRAPHPDLPREAFWRIAAGRAVLATGAIERPIAFPGNDRPGVMLAGAVRHYLTRYGALVPGPLVLFTNNDDAYRTAWDLAPHLRVTVVDCRPDGPEAPGPVLRGMAVVGTRGRLGLTAVTVDGPAGRRDLPAATLAVSGGWSPTLHLASHLGHRPRWREDIAAFVPGAVEGLQVLGAAAGNFSTAAALDGRAIEPAPPMMPLWEVPAKGRAFVDFQNDVTTKDIRAAVAEGFGAVEHLKRYTTLGMATDQGKTGNMLALGILADETGQSIPETGTTTFRPPYTPVSIAALGAGGAGRGFLPERLPPSHAISKARGAAFVEAGHWMRAAWYPHGAETWRQACDREALMVRRSVGICDVSTLGKIALFGAVGPFLDRVYAGTFSTLQPGRVRYGIMLREDGLAMDDGTTARLGDEWLMTTTTAAAGQVMAHLELMKAALGAEVWVDSVTDHWAQFAVAGPRARELLEGLLGPVTLPFMGCEARQVLGQPGRLYRISFSGELAYEIAIPAAHGAALFQALLDRAEALGGGPYGMEALNVLRIEKGHITHAEMHGRVTAADLGFGRMVKPGSIGHALSQRPGLTEDREELVGLRALSGRLLAGARLIPEGADPRRDTDRGYTTSVCHSPTLGQDIALGFLRGGRARHGERVRAIDLVRGAEALCLVGPPAAVDPEGTRVRA